MVVSFTILHILYSLCTGRLPAASADFAHDLYVIAQDRAKTQELFCSNNRKLSSEEWQTVSQIVAENIPKDHRNAEAMVDALVDQCGHAVPLLNACLKNSKDYSRSIKNGKDDPFKANLPDFVKDPELLKKLLYRKDREAAQRYIREVVNANPENPKCESYPFIATQPANDNRLNKHGQPMRISREPGENVQDVLGRLMIKCKSSDGTVLSLAVAYRNNDEEEKKYGPLGNISVVEETPAGPSTVNPDERIYHARYADHERYEPAEGQFRFMRRKDGKDGQSCTTCHLNGALAVTKDQLENPSYTQNIKAWRFGREIRPAHSINFAHDGSEIDPKAFGPPLGTYIDPNSPTTPRNENFFKECTKGIPEFKKMTTNSALNSIWKSTQQKLRTAMNCTSCHDGQKTPWQDNVVAPILNGPVLKSTFYQRMLRTGKMPPEMFLTEPERKALEACLAQEYLGGESSKGQLIKWLSATSCATGDRAETSGAVPQKVDPRPAAK